MLVQCLASNQHWANTKCLSLYTWYAFSLTHYYALVLISLHFVPFLFFHLFFDNFILLVLKPFLFSALTSHMRAEESHHIVRAWSVHLDVIVTLKSPVCPHSHFIVWKYDLAIIGLCRRGFHQCDLNGHILGDTIRWISAGLTLVQRHIRWTNVKPTFINVLCLLATVVHIFYNTGNLWDIYILFCFYHRQRNRLLWRNEKKIKHDMLNHCRVNVGAASQTMYQH